MLKTVIESCLSQDLDREFEVLLIDSASVMDASMHCQKTNDSVYTELGKVLVMDAPATWAELAQGIRCFHHAGRDSCKSHVADESYRSTAKGSNVAGVFDCHIAMRA